MILSVITKPRSEPRGRQCRAIYARQRPSALPDRAGILAMLLGALQVHTLPRIDAHLLAFGDEFRDLHGHAVRELRGLGARRLGSASQARCRLCVAVLLAPRALEAHQTAVAPFDPHAQFEL